MLILVVSCGDASPATPADIFIPPTLVSTPIPTRVPTSTHALATPTQVCTDNLRYLADITIPDDTRVAPGETLDKRWLVENNGSCNWDSAYQLRWIGGNDLGAQHDQALFPARSGAEVTIEIEFTAPYEVGRHQSTWQAYNPQGNPFGDPIFIQIVVISATQEGE